MRAGALFTDLQICEAPALVVTRVPVYLFKCAGEEVDEGQTKDYTQHPAFSQQTS